MWQRELEASIARQLEELRNPPTPSTNVSHLENKRQSANSTGNTEHAITRYNCGRVGHTARCCRQPHWPDYPPAELNSPDAAKQVTYEAVITNHTTSTWSAASTSNAIYVRATIHEQPQLCLLGTGSKVSILLANFVRGLELEITTRVLLAANGTLIRGNCSTEVLAEFLSSIPISCLGSNFRAIIGHGMASHSSLSHWF